MVNAAPDTHVSIGPPWLSMSTSTGSSGSNSTATLAMLSTDGAPGTNNITCYVFNQRRKHILFAYISTHILEYTDEDTAISHVGVEDELTASRNK